MTEVRTGALGWPGDMPPVLPVAPRPQDTPSFERLLAGALSHEDEDPLLRDTRLAIAQRDSALSSVLALTTQRDALRTENAELRRLAYTDELTGLPNRRAINMILDELVEREGGTFGVTIVDLDELKKENTEGGLAGGDRAIINTADQIKLDRAAAIVLGSLRTRDSAEHPKRLHDLESSDAARIGGDEFLVVLRGIQSQQQLTVVNNRLITNLRKGGVKFSSGTAMHQPGMTREEVVAEADAAEAVDKLQNRARRQARSIRAISAEKRSAEEEVLAVLAARGISIEEFWSRRGPTSR